jgi:hypothetical protein
MIGFYTRPTSSQDRETGVLKTLDIQLAHYWETYSAHSSSCCACHSLPLKVGSIDSLNTNPTN